MALVRLAGRAGSGVGSAVRKAGDGLLAVAPGLGHIAVTTGYLAYFAVRKMHLDAAKRRAEEHAALQEEAHADTAAPEAKPAEIEAASTPAQEHEEAESVPVDANEEFTPVPAVEPVAVEAHEEPEPGPACVKPPAVEEHKEPEPVHVEEHKEPEPVHVEEHKEPEPVHVDEHKEPEPVHAEEHKESEADKEPEPAHVEEHKEPEPVHVEEHKEPEPEPEPPAEPEPASEPATMEEEHKESKLTKVLMLLQEQQEQIARNHNEVVSALSARLDRLEAAKDKADNDKTDDEKLEANDLQSSSSAEVSAQKGSSDVAEKDRNGAEWLQTLADRARAGRPHESVPDTGKKAQVVA